MFFERTLFLNQESITVGPADEIYFTTPKGGNSTACGDRSGCGTLYKVVPPVSGGGWTSVLLHTFTGQQGDGFQPNGGLVVTRNGTVYGTTNYGGRHFFGTVFKYTP